MKFQIFILLQLVGICWAGNLFSGFQEWGLCPWFNCTLTCRVFQYQVGEYHLQIRFIKENLLYWEYLSAPNGLTGRNATENIDVAQIRGSIFLLQWRESDGSQVIDVLDIGKMIMYSNYVDIRGNRYSAQAKLKAMKNKC